MCVIFGLDLSNYTTTTQCLEPGIRPTHGKRNIIFQWLDGMTKQIVLLKLVLEWILEKWQTIANRAKTNVNVIFSKHYRKRWDNGAAGNEGDRAEKYKYTLESRAHLSTGYVKLNTQGCFRGQKVTAGTTTTAALTKYSMTRGSWG